MSVSQNGGLIGALDEHAGNKKFLFPSGLDTHNVQTDATNIAVVCVHGTRWRCVDKSTTGQWHSTARPYHEAMDPLRTGPESSLASCPGRPPKRTPVLRYGAPIFKPWESGTPQMCVMGLCCPVPMPTPCFWLAGLLCVSGRGRLGMHPLSAQHATCM